MLLFNSTNRACITNTDIEALCGLVSLFQGIDEITRKLGEHVVNETDDWVPVLCVVYEINRLVTLFAQIENEHIVECVLECINSHTRIIEQEVEIDGNEFSVSVPATTSLHYPLQYLLALFLRRKHRSLPPSISAPSMSLFGLLSKINSGYYILNGRSVRFVLANTDRSLFCTTRTLYDMFWTITCCFSKMQRQSHGFYQP